MRYQTGSQKWMTLFADPIRAIFQNPCIALIGKDGELDDTTLCDEYLLCTETEDEKTQHTVKDKSGFVELCLGHSVVIDAEDVLRPGDYCEDNMCICYKCLEIAKVLKLVSQDCDGRSIC